MKNKKIILTGLGLLSLIVLFTITYKIFFNKDFNPPHIKVVEVEKAKLQDIIQTSRLIGTIKSKNYTRLISKSSGTLIWNKSIGDKLQKGDLIAKIANQNIEDNYNLSLKLEQIAKEQYNRSFSLSKSGMNSKEEVDTKKHHWHEAQKALSNASIALNNIHFYAPFDGVIGMQNIKDNNYTTENKSIGVFYDPSAYIIEFDIPLTLLKSSKKIIVNGNQYPIHVENVIDNETLSFPAYVDYKCDNECIIGDTIYIDLITAEHNNIVIPFESVFMKNGQAFVYLVKDNKAEITPVKLGVREKDKAEILSGINEGDDIIRENIDRVYPGLSVQIHNEEKK